jgi:two-component system cell cycle sensor histidine kinase/response regulator CckA
LLPLAVSDKLLTLTADPSQKANTVLVVDDEADMLRLVEAILTEQGYKVLLAKGADTAIKTFERMQPKPDLILTDVVMPGMSGPMLVDHLLTIDPAIKVLFMSGYDDRQVVQRYVVEKGFSLVPKPFTLQRLSAAVQDVLSGRQVDPMESPN